MESKISKIQTLISQGKFTSAEKLVNALVQDRQREVTRLLNKPDQKTTLRVFSELQNALFLQGVVNLKLNKFDQANEIFDKILAVYKKKPVKKEIGANKFISIIWLQKFELAKLTNDPQIAKLSIKNALKFSEDTGAFETQTYIQALDYSFIIDDHKWFNQLHKKLKRKLNKNEIEGSNQIIILLLAYQILGEKNTKKKVETLKKSLDELDEDQTILLISKLLLLSEVGEMDKEVQILTLNSAFRLLKVGISKPDPNIINSITNILVQVPKVLNDLNLLIKDPIVTIEEIRDIDEMDQFSVIPWIPALMLEFYRSSNVNILEIFEKVATEWDSDLFENSLLLYLLYRIIGEGYLEINPKKAVHYFELIHNSNFDSRSIEDTLHLVVLYYNSKRYNDAYLINRKLLKALRNKPITNSKIQIELLDFQLKTELGKHFEPVNFQHFTQRALNHLENGDPLVQQIIDFKEKLNN